MSVTSSDTTLMIRITRSLRDKVAAMSQTVFVHGKRCHKNGTREVPPHQMVLLEAAWEVAQRYPEELSMAIMRRTEPREEIGIRADHLATGHRPR